MPLSSWSVLRMLEEPISIVRIASIKFLTNGYFLCRQHLLSALPVLSVISALAVFAKIMLVEEFLVNTLQVRIDCQ